MSIEASLHLRPLQAADWEAVRAIYLEGITTRQANFQTDAPSSREMWDKNHLPICRWIAEREHTILGWAMLSPTSNRCVYAGVAEVSIYVAQLSQGQGVGYALLNQLIQDSEKNGLWTLEASIFPENLSSLKLHKRCGFREVGIREKLGKLNGQWRDVVLFERRSKIVI